jgi:hypothetical protein
LRPGFRLDLTGINLGYVSCISIPNLLPRSSPSLRPRQNWSPYLGDTQLLTHTASSLTSKVERGYHVHLTMRLIFLFVARFPVVSSQSEIQTTNPSLFHTLSFFLCLLLGVGSVHLNGTLPCLSMPDSHHIKKKTPQETLMRHHHHTIFTKLINPVLRNIHSYRPPSKNKALKKRKQPVHPYSLRLSSDYASYTRKKSPGPKPPFALDSSSGHPSTPPHQLMTCLPFQYLVEGTASPISPKPFPTQQAADTRRQPESKPTQPSPPQPAPFRDSPPTHTPTKHKTQSQTKARKQASNQVSQIPNPRANYASR